jgi:hypothetical protein
MLHEKDEINYNRDYTSFVAEIAKWIDCQMGTAMLYISSCSMFEYLDYYELKDPI